MNIMSRQRSLLAGLLIGAAGIINSHAANSTIITFSVDMATNIANSTFNPATDTVYARGTFNGWPSPGLALVQEGSSTVYTNSANDTLEANGSTTIWQYTFVDNSATTYEGSPNRCAKLPATSGASLVLPTPYFNDAGAPVVNSVTFQVDMSQQIQLGAFTNGVGTVEARGSFEGWTGGLCYLTNNPSISVTNSFGLVTSNVYQGSFLITNSPNGKQEYKYVMNGGSYEGPGNSDSDYDNSNNRYFVNVAQTLPLVNFSDAPYAPLSQVRFSVDMSAQLYYGNWTPSDGVFCAGVNGDWNNDTINTATNDPSASNTNIYYATFTVGEGSTAYYKFTYNGSSGTVYESPTSTGGNNRVFTVPTQSAITVPTVLFSDLGINDLLVSNTLVTFSVDMSHAVQYGTSTAFNPASDTVFVNGAWLGWLGWDPISLASYQLTNNPVGSSIYSLQVLFPKGSSLPVTYKYSIDGADNEAAANQNHERVIRSIATGAYSFATDTFGNQYDEPAFGKLSVRNVSGGNVQLSWLGAPNVEVQTSSSITGSWTTLPQTSGEFWSAGINTTNGLLSVTNIPTSGNSYFRLIQN